jgi:hypothetical protein
MSQQQAIPIRTLLDNGIFCHSEFAEGLIMQKEIWWGGSNQVTYIHGVRRKSPHTNAELQKQINALPTIGRLIREHLIAACDYKEIWRERMRFRPVLPFGNALQGCVINTCISAIDSGKFAQTVDITDYFAKGGRKDRKAGIVPGRANQIAFFEFLCSLTDAAVDVLIAHAEPLRLSAFEVESLRNIGWFQFLCQRSGSPENYPDVFHLWTAERNGLDVLLTLDNGLPELVSRVRKEKAQTIEIKTEVLRPLELLDLLEVRNREPVGLDDGRFYYLHELC